MRVVTFGVGSSLDNFIARPDHTTDWLAWSDEVAAISADYWKTIDTVVMGRKTYEVAVKLGTTSYPGVKNYVFSRTLKPAPNAKVAIVASDAVEFMRRLKEQPGKGICVMGGGELANSLFQANVIDEVGVNIHPVLLGAGIPLFLPMQQVNLELVEHQVLKNGCVYLRYRVKR
ncbi:MAG: dihydrofolate reductase family protein [Gemmatimonadaceae bacterium]